MYQSKEYEVIFILFLEHKIVKSCSYVRNPNKLCMYLCMHAEFHSGTIVIRNTCLLSPLGKKLIN